jgi:hypothetical protein
MPNLRSQSIDANGLELVASDGRSFTLTRAEVMVHFQSETGGRAARLSKTIQWVKDSIEAALGAEQVPAFLIDFDFDDIQGLRSLGVRS